jgi:serine/threonine protein phosphatase 1
VAIRSIRFDEPVAVIGDIHGRKDLLDALLARLGARGIVVIGDVCDRGPHTREVVERLATSRAVGVVGNHDEWFREWACRRGFDSFALHPMMGGRATLDSYGVAGRTVREIESEAWRVPDDHRKWLEQLAVVVDLEVISHRYWLIHAGLPKREAIARMPREQVVPWLVQHHPHALLHEARHPGEMPAVDRPVVMGHVPLLQPIDTGAVIAIDTGSGTFQDGGRLTAVLLPERRFVSVGPR